MHQLDTTRIIGTLARLKAVGSAAFGVEAHGFRVNARLSEADAWAFEQDHKIVLPADFRVFLTDVGNGGAGPFYGVFPLGQMDDNVGLRQWNENDGLVGILSEPFLLEEPWNDLSGIPNSELESQNEAEYWAQMDSFEKRYWSSILVNGAIPICHEGCALRIWLVVTGRRPGYLWEDRRSENEGLLPVRLANGSPATFGSWYEQWLDDCVATVNGKQLSNP